MEGERRVLAIDGGATFPRRRVVPSRIVGEDSHSASDRDLLQSTRTATLRTAATIPLLGGLPTPPPLLGRFERVFQDRRRRSLQSSRGLTGQQSCRLIDGGGEKRFNTSATRDFAEDVGQASFRSICVKRFPPSDTRASSSMPARDPGLAAASRDVAEIISTKNAERSVGPTDNGFGGGGGEEILLKDKHLEGREGTVSAQSLGSFPEGDVDGLVSWHFPNVATLLVGCPAAIQTDWRRSLRQ